MRVRIALLRGLLVGLLVVLTAGCSTDEGAVRPGSDVSSSGPQSAAPTVAATPAPPPSPPPPPDNGACYRLDFEEALAPVTDVEPVRCRRAHTSQTFRVGRLDRGVEVDSARAQRQARETCTRELGPSVGTDQEGLRLSLVKAVWFTPTLEEGTAGARWFRCDAIATTGTERLLRLPRTLQDAVGRFSLCATAEPGSAGSQRVACSRRHSWVALATVDLGGSAYPSAEEAAVAMDDTCRARARDAADDPLDFTWSEERPTRPQWRAGQRYGICWAPA